MDVSTLTQEASQLVQQAKERVGAGTPDQAKARLQSLRDLLTKELPVKAEPGPLPPESEQQT